MLRTTQCHIHHVVKRFNEVPRSSGLSQIRGTGRERFPIPLSESRTSARSVVPPRGGGDPRGGGGLLCGAVVPRAPIPPPAGAEPPPSSRPLFPHKLVHASYAAYVFDGGSVLRGGKRVKNDPFLSVKHGSSARNRPQRHPGYGRQISQTGRKRRGTAGIHCGVRPEDIAGCGRTGSQTNLRPPAGQGQCLR
jgi:hypothetical protein